MGGSGAAGSRRLRTGARTERAFNRQRNTAGSLRSRLSRARGSRGYLASLARGR